MGTAVRSMKQAARLIKRMDYEGESWEPVRQAGLSAMRQAIEEQMRWRVGVHLERCAGQGVYDRRNGSFGRSVATALGTMDLTVPRTRSFSAVATAQSYARRHREVDQAVLACFTLGLSTRKVGEALLPLIGESISASTVSRVARQLDEAVVQFHRRALSDEYKVLILDGVVLARKTGAGAVRRPVLVALGIRHDGKKEILDFRLVPAESQTAWEAFLTDLYRRGLKGESLELIVTDGGKGMEAALPLVFPQIPVERCWAHKTRNVLEKIRKIDQPAAKRDLHRISHARNRVAARTAARRFADRWRGRYPKAVACLRKDLEELLQFFQYDEDDWRKATRTTNAIERRFVEVRRRTRPMGVFSDRTSLERILLAVFVRENWKQGSGTPLLALTQNS